MERFIRTYVDYQQGDWIKWLALAEFAANNAPSATTKVSPFYANKGFHPRMSFDIRPKVRKARNSRESNERVRAVKAAKHLKSLWEMLQDQIGLAQTRMEHFANTKRKPAPAYQVGDMVWLSAKNIKTQRPSKKLDSKNLGPYKMILEKVGATSYRLKLPDTLKIHPVFHSNLLRLDPDDPLPGQIPEPPPPVIIDDEEEWEVEKVLDSRISQHKLQYRVAWVGYPPDPKWYNANLLENSPGLRREFHAAYPRKSRTWQPSQELGSKRDGGDVTIKALTLSAESQAVGMVYQYFVVVVVRPRNGLVRAGYSSVFSQGPSPSI
jgi:hypothetical protein